MSVWSINPSAALGVLDEVRTSSSDLSIEFGRVATAQEDLLLGLTGLPGVAEAIAGVLESESVRFINVSNRISAGVLGAGTALNCYLNADEEMAAHAQRAAVDASASGDFSFFAA